MRRITDNKHPIQRQALLSQWNLHKRADAGPTLCKMWRTGGGDDDALSLYGGAGLLWRHWGMDQPYEFSAQRGCVQLPHSCNRAT